MFSVGVEIGRKRDLDKRCLSFVGAQPVKIRKRPEKRGGGLDLSREYVYSFTRL